MQGTQLSPAAAENVHSSAGLNTTVEGYGGTAEIPASILNNVLHSMIVDAMSGGDSLLCDKNERD